MLVIVALAMGLSIFGADNNSNPSKADEIIQPYIVNEVVRPITLKNKEEADVVLDSSLPDKTLITLWDATCGECPVGLPIINTFAAAHPEINTIFINIKNDKAQAEEALKKYNLNFDTLYDREGVTTKVWFATMPATYFVRNGSFKVFFPGRVSAEHLNALLTLD